MGYCGGTRFLLITDLPQGESFGLQPRAALRHVLMLLVFSLL
jgi:hypothetical protein